MEKFQIQFKFVFLFLLSFFASSALAQIQPTIPAKVDWDTLGYDLVDEDHLPEPIPCQEGGIHFLKYHFSMSEIVDFDAKSDVIETDKDEWTEEDEEDYEKKYNEDHKEELEKKLEEYDEERRDLYEIGEEDFEHFIRTRLLGTEYNICDPDCESVIQECSYAWLSHFIRNGKTQYRYKTRISWLEENDDGPNEVEIDFMLMLHYEGWLFLDFACGCTDIPDIVSATPGEIQPPWDNLALTGRIMKPGFLDVEVPVDGSTFPWLPVIGGAAGAGILTWLLVDGDEGGQDCQWVIATSTSTAVCGNPNGTGSVAVSPTGEYDYSWSNGATGPFQSNLLPGSYMVTVTQPGTSCSRVVSLEVMNENVDFTATVGTVASDCGADNGTAFTEVVPPGTYTFLWSTGSTSPSLSGLAPGNYLLTISSGLTCTENYNVQVGELPPNFFIDIMSNPASCGMEDGSAIALIDLPGSYEYLWSNGDTTAEISGLAAGEYEVTVTISGKDCQKSSSELIGEEPPVLGINWVITGASCGMEDGAITIEMIPPGDYDFLWSNGSTAQDLVDVQAGDYQLTVTIAGTECALIADLTVFEAGANFDLTFTTTPADCGQDNGSVSLSVDPAGEYEFLWSNGATTSTVDGLPPGDFEVTVTLSGTVCQVIGNVTIEEEAPNFIIEFTTTPADCGETNGSASVTVEPPGEYLFIWSTGATGNEITDLASGEYTVTITIAGTNCTDTRTVTVEESEPNFSIQITTTPADCGIGNGSAEVTVDPKGEYTYSWSNGSTDPAITDLPEGEYTVTVTNQGGCAVTGDGTIEEIPADLITDISMVPGNCLGDGSDILIELQTQGGGPMTVIATGPDGAHEISVPVGMTSLNDFFTVLPGQWTILVRDANLPEHCSEDTSIEVDDNTPMLQLTDDNYNGLVDQEITGNVFDNDLGFNITITDNTLPTGGTLIVNPDGSFTFTPPPGETGQFSFQYTATDACGNSAVAEVVITITSKDCTFTASFMVDPSHCGLSVGVITTMTEPGGEYTFIWNTGATTADLHDLPAGTYSVTITNIDQQCDQVFEVIVEEAPIVYVFSVNSTPGTCIGMGEITIVLETPGQGSLILEIEGPDGNTELTLSVGTHNLSEFINIPSGVYTITVYDDSIGEECTVTVEVTVEDNTPEIMAVNDVYATPFNTPVDGNVIDNDQGLEIVFFGISNLVGGTVMFDPDGSFTFTPNPGFSGAGGFTYSISDACGNFAMAEVEIFVEMAVCDYEAIFDNSNADCGLENGSSFVTVNQPGTYIFTWSNGIVGQQIENVPAGVYTVTVESVDLNCELVFETEIFEDPADYISNVVVMQPTCSTSGEIQFDLSSSSGGPFDLNISHPNGNDVFSVPSGTVVLSDLISITAGDYTIDVTDQNASADCIDMLEVTIDEVLSPEIVLEGVTPPSEPSAMDGTITVVISVPSAPPYTILLDGDVWGATPEPFFTIEGVGAGFYTVQVQDANGCFSNILEVEVPLPPEPLIQIGFGVLSGTSPQSAIPELPAGDNSAWTNSFIEVSMRYHAVGVGMENNILLALGNAMPIWRFEHLGAMWQSSRNSWNFKLQLGFSSTYTNGQFNPAARLQGRMERSIGQGIRMKAEVGLDGAGRGLQGNSKVVVYLAAWH